MDPDIYTEVTKLRTAIFVNPDHASKFRGYLKKYKGLRSNFPSELSPAVAFAGLFKEAKDSGERALEFRMRAVLDKIGSTAGGGYSPKVTDFPYASPAVLVWIANKFIAQESTPEAVLAMERLTQVFGETGGEFLFDAYYVLGRASEKVKDYAEAANFFDVALTNSIGHELDNDARIRRGHAFFKVAKATKSASAFEKAYSSFEEVRKDSETNLELRAQCSFMMGECRKSSERPAKYREAAFLYLETTLNFPSAVEWVPKAFDQAISCFEQTGPPSQITLVNKQYVAWQRKFLK
jgi:tetratricopeptide (TPR) repeat protein